MKGAKRAHTVFLISPARCNGGRAGSLLTSKTSRMGKQLRTHGAPLGELMTWLSALYFRGKLTYAQAFAQVTTGVPGSLIMAAGLGLRAPETVISAEQFVTMGDTDIESDAFVEPLSRDARVLDAIAGPDARVVLLGSIATGKYVDPLLDVFGERLLFPGCFVGRGDMSRGGLLLRASRSGEPLEYTPIRGATLHGVRPPKLPKLPRQSAGSASRPS
ncbi:MAG TPA: hypothetical protein VFQ53_12210 [Kofleriaceae bacterium]|nr:hypothetical protein [Kofleriaceae bacterium]